MSPARSSRAHALAGDRCAGILEQPERFVVAAKLDADLLEDPVGMTLERLQCLLVERVIGRDPPRDRRRFAGCAVLAPRDASRAWRDWFEAAGRTYPTTPNDLVIPDPNVRVQAVIDGQGLALNDRLVADDLAAGHLVQISPVALEDYGYFLAYPKGALNDVGCRAFRDWIIAAAYSMRS